MAEQFAARQFAVQCRYCEQKGGGVGAKVKWEWRCPELTYRPQQLHLCISPHQCSNRSEFWRGGRIAKREWRSWCPVWRRVLGRRRLWTMSLICGIQNDVIFNMLSMITCACEDTLKASRTQSLHLPRLA